MTEHLTSDNHIRLSAKKVGHQAVEGMVPALPGEPVNPIDPIDGLVEDALVLELAIEEQELSKELGNS